MFSKTIIIAVAAAALLSSAVAPAHAALTSNGFGNNGVNFNGVVLNGGGDNGLDRNGFVNNGSTDKGIDAGLKGFAIDGVELLAR